MLPSSPHYLVAFGSQRNIFSSLFGIKCHHGRRWSGHLFFYFVPGFVTFLFILPFISGGVVCFLLSCQQSLHTCSQPSTLLFQPGLLLHSSSDYLVCHGTTSTMAGFLIFESSFDLFFCRLCRFDHHASRSPFCFLV